MTMPYEPTPMGVHMAGGFQDGRGPMSPGLEAQSQRWSELGAASAEAPQSVLHQLTPSANAMSGRDSQRLLPSGELLPTQNGQGESAYESGTQMLMRGVQTQYNTPVGSQV